MPARKNADNPLLAVSLAVIPMSVIDGSPTVLLRRSVLGELGLPNSGLQPGEALEDAARRTLSVQAPIAKAYLEQLYTFASGSSQSPAITIAYLALVPEREFAVTLDARADLTLAEVIVPWQGESGGTVDVCTPGGAPLTLVDGDGEVLGQTMLRLRGKLDYSGVGFALLPPLFTLRQLQDVHEAILGVRLNKPAFRRRMLDRGWLEATGERETGASFRPAELYRYNPKGA